MTTTETTSSGPAAPHLVEAHRESLQQGREALASRGYFSRYPESPSPRVYGEHAAPDGVVAFETHLGSDFSALGDQPTDGMFAGSEVSPYGPKLRVRYPRLDVDAAIAAAGAAMPVWRDAGALARAAVCVEIVDAINKRSFEIANAVMHTSGQPFVMSFQAGGPHAQDRAFEAVVGALVEQERVPASVVWENPGKDAPLRMRKDYRIVPRGIALVVGCNTFPTWNSYPGLFASLVTGNAVVVKPHPGAVLPLAITVAIARDVLADAGFSPDLVQLAAEQPGEGLAKVLALRPEVKVIDYTGSTGFGTWLEQNAHQASVFTEKAGVNTVVIDSTDDYRGMLANLAFSLSLYSGQMCTTPQNLLVPRDGITADGAHKTVDELAADLAAAVDGLLGDDARATALLGAVVNPGVLERLEKAPSYGDVVLASRTVTHPDFPDAVVRTPTVVKVDVADRDTYLQECFGPVSFLVTTGSTAESIDLLRESVRDHGAITAAVYSTDDKVLDATEEAALDAGVALSENLTETVYVNQSAAFSDFHATGANPAANSALTDAAYVASRFRIVQSRRHLPADPASA